MLYPHQVPKFVDHIFSKNKTWRKQTDSKEIYLTFDDGPHPEITPYVLDLLDKYQAKATFFCVGQNVEKHPQVFDMILQRRHSVGNHTFNHLSGWKTPLALYVENTMQCNNLIQSKLFRPPYGKITSSQSKELLNMGFEIIMWSLLSGDFYKTLNQEKALQKLNKLSKAGQIVVFHDSEKARKNLEYILPRYLDYLCQNDFKTACL